MSLATRLTMSQWTENYSIKENDNGTRVKVWVIETRQINLHLIKLQWTWTNKNKNII